MTDLLASQSEAARAAVAYYVCQVGAAIGASAPPRRAASTYWNTGGIGEHADAVREQICAPLAFMGIALDAVANRQHATRLEAAASKPVLMIPADEETEIARLTTTLLQVPEKK